MDEKNLFHFCPKSWLATPLMQQNAVDFVSVSTEHYHIHNLRSSTLDLYFLEGAALGTEREVPQTEFSESTE